MKNEQSDTEKDPLAEFREDFSLLLEAGFIAVKQLDEISAMRIFAAAQMMYPTHTAPQIGFGYISLNKLELPKAIECFRKILSLEPDNHLAKAFLGMSLVLKKETVPGETMIREVLETTDDPTIKNLCTNALRLSSLPTVGSTNTQSSFLKK